MNDFKNVWSAMDSLRGMMTIEESVQHVLPLMTLQNVEKRYSDKFIIPEEAKWSNLIRSGMNIGQKLDRAVAILEAENSSLKGVLSIVTFSKIDDAPLYNIVLHLKDLPENVGVIVKELLYKAAEAAGKIGREDLTPPTLTELVVRLLNVREGASFYDGVAGVGQFLLRAAESANDVSLYGQEKNPTTWAIAKMNCI